MWQARVRLHNRSNCTCSWLPEYYATWTSLLELHLNPFAEDTSEDDTESHGDLSTRTALLLAQAFNTVVKPWINCEEGQEPECTLANGRDGHERKAREMAGRLRSVLDLWLTDMERNPVEGSDSDSDSSWEVQGNELVPYTGGTRYYEEEDEYTPYPPQVYDQLPRDDPIPEEIDLDSLTMDDIASDVD